MEAKKCVCLLAFLMVVMIIDARSSPIEEEDPKSEAQLYYDQVSEFDRDHFVRYFLAKGLNEEGYPVRSPRLYIKDIEETYGAPPEGFSATLLSVARNTLGFEDSDVAAIIIEGYVCIPAKGCYDPNDVGQHCCLLDAIIYDK